MGKSGEALRDKKGSRGRFYTNAEMASHDLAVRQAYRKQCLEELERENAKMRKDLQRKVDEANRKIREANEEMESTRQDYQMEMLNLLLCVSCRILIEEFGFPSVKQDKPHPANRTYRFANALVQTMNSFGDGDETEFLRYCEETIDLYGVGFRRVEDGSTKD